MITVLFLAANPGDTTRLRLDAESRAVDMVLRESEFRNLFRLEKQYAVHSADLMPLLLRFQPDIMHFSGHGLGEEGIILENDRGRAEAVSTAFLSGLLGIAGKKVRCVVLNACYSEVQAQAIASSVDCVVGLSGAAGDDAAIAFATAFYQALGYGQDVKTAFDLARLHMSGTGDEQLPQLVTREEGLATLTFAAQQAGEAGNQDSPSPATGQSQFSTVVQGGSVGQVINVENLGGGLNISPKQSKS